MIFLDSLHGSRWRVILCVSDLIHTTTAQYDDEGDAQGFVGVGRQERIELEGQQYMEGRRTVMVLRDVFFAQL